ncbi:HypC/HybG/HupF family hydrogenase formation chaperone [Tropicibacter naphthalenivorans]|uniref:Hydrogenase assembly chaperone HypC/HupF n=1 Tax=Tropicibacter naphthalenivorans TaxID=441103 RepID=A0A0P1G2A1_9RHOB|nr:HypC/HybG/HupF family hydrogenase formation chaperone [Tropicibacter naphthalenivorans]CUH75920.1 hydrogenase assembly chaperone HypC/HupF [Tropicibacter naphthalenivorans]SMC41301.1 hydrogenase expression/formation protein HypC [Tropicibacter naphthalenivorans]
MCVGQPVQILSVDGIAATALEDGREVLIDLSLTGPVEPGQWVLTFLGCAREVISADEADKISKALHGLRSLMTGGELGKAFADLDEATPQLPPHLQAALDAGHSTG